MIVVDTADAVLVVPRARAQFGAVLWVGRNQLTFDRAILLIGVAYLIIIGFNSFLHRYFYFPGLILAALAIAYAANGPLSPADETRRSG